MNYTLHQLHVFSKVVQYRSITKASEALYMTQPAVSIQLKNFQDQFDIPLTTVVGRQLHITDFGREIALMAERILNEVYAINYKTMAYKGVLAGKLKVSVVSTGKYIMPYFLAGFLREHTGVELVMDVTNKHRVVQSLEHYETDFALVSVLPEQLPLEQELLMENKLYLVGGKQRQWKQRNDKRIFSELPFLFREEGSATRRVTEQYFERHGIHVRKMMELTSNEAIKQAILAGLGYSIMPLIGLRNELANRELQIIPVTGLPLRSSWRLVWLRRNKLPPVGEAFLGYLRQYKTDILHQSFGWIRKFRR